MDLSIYPAFAGAELEAMLQYPGKTAWLGCHLSAYGSGITPLPAALKHCDMLVLTDEMPPEGHDSKAVAAELWSQANILGCERILLDFQRPPSEESLQIIQCVLEKAYVPVGVTSKYAQQLTCPVFLAPPPLWTPLEEAISPWVGREIWLEIAPESGCVTLTKEGSSYAPCGTKPDYPFTDHGLCLSYKAEIYANKASVFLHRGISNLPHWLVQAEALGIRAAVGLYQQLSPLLQKQALQSAEFMV